MTSVEVSAKTVEEALSEAIKMLGVKRDNVEVEIINEPSQGFFKLLGGRPAKIKVSILKKPSVYIRDSIKKIVHIIGIDGEVNISKEDEENIFLEIKGEKLGLLIGKHGSTLNDLQYLANVILHRQFESVRQRVIIDIENYRQKRKRTLEHLAQNLAFKALRLKKEINLEPMTPNERRIIHLALKGNRDVVTYSKGDEPFRKVIIAPK
ncbi:MAG TPA: protein jag [Firmicutes bacterium]|jgi:spoIIIJ-associated protein|nr:protein jag [Bacillota bacterium]